MNEILFNQLCNKKFDNNILYGRGLIDINEHLNTLRYYASKCDHITEMGTRFAISVYAFLMGKPKTVISIDLNHHFFQPYEQEVNDSAKILNVNFQFIHGDVLELDIEQTDLLFIDTLHTYEQLTKELTKHNTKVNKWIVLHDTVTFGFKDEEFYQNGSISKNLTKQDSKQGLYIAVRDFLQLNPQWTIKEHFTKNNGLTVLERSC